MGDPSTQPTWNHLPSPAPTHSIKLWLRGRFDFPPVGNDTTLPNLAFSDYTGETGPETALQSNFENLVISKERQPKAQKPEQSLPAGSQGVPKTFPGTEPAFPRSRP